MESCENARHLSLVIDLTPYELWDNAVGPNEFDKSQWGIVFEGLLELQSANIRASTDYW